MKIYSNLSLKKLRIPIMHCHFLRKNSQNRDYIQTHCNDRRNPFHFAHKRDMTYDFYLKHIMPACERKLNAMINKDKNPINKLPRIWRHPIIAKFNCYRNNEK